MNEFVPQLQVELNPALPSSDEQNVKNDQQSVEDVADYYFLVSQGYRKFVCVFSAKTYWRMLFTSLASSVIF